MINKKKRVIKRNPIIGNSLVVQWLGLCTFIVRDSGSIPDWGTKLPQTSMCGQKIKLYFNYKINYNELHETV